MLFEKAATASQAGEDAVVTALAQMTIAQIRQLVATASEEELAFMLDGVAMNEALASYSESNAVGVGIAQNMRKRRPM